MEGQRLSEEQIARVLHRAAELDRSDDDAGRLDAMAVEAAAVEAGLSREAVCQALAELRVGALEGTGAPARRSLLGSASLVVRRVVPGPLPAVEREVRGYLAAQLFEQRRHYGDRTVWGRREGLMPSLRRSLDLNHRLSLNGVRQLEVALADEPGTGPGRVVVHLDADVGEQRSAQAWTLCGGAAAGAGVVGGTALVADLIVVLASLPVGTGLLLGGHVLGRAHYTSQVAKVETALAGLLDRLEHRPVLSQDHGRAPLSPERWRAASGP